MQRAFFGWMAASSAALLVAAACGGLADQGTGSSDDVSGPARGRAGGEGAAAPSASSGTPEHVTSDVGVPSAIALATDRLVIATRRTMLNGSLREAGGLFVVHERLGPSLLVAMDDGSATYDALAVQDDFAYVATSDARVLRVPAAGGATSVLAELPAPAAAIAAAGKYVYVATTSGVVERVPTDGVGALEPVVTVPGKPRALSVGEDGSVYVATAVSDGHGGSILRVAPEGGEAAVLATSPASPCAMTRAGDELFFTAEAAVHRLLVEGGPARTVSAGTSSACALAIDGDELWFASASGLLRAPAAGGPAVAVTGAAKPAALPGAVAVGPKHLYWIEGTAVLRMAKPAR